MTDQPCDNFRPVTKPHFARGDVKVADLCECGHFKAAHAARSGHALSPGWLKRALDAAVESRKYLPYWLQGDR